VRQIVVGYDGTEESDRAVARAADVAEAFSARLVVVSVTASRPATAVELAPVIPEPITVPSSLPVAVAGLDSEPPLESGVERSPGAAELAERQVERARSALLGRAVEAEFVVEVGEPAERLLDVAEQRDAELIVVGSREHGFLDRLLGRPFDEQVARRADRDVLIVH
jgi:nucleotide-binding universal stress UspA family protein